MEIETIHGDLGLGASALSPMGMFFDEPIGLGVLSTELQMEAAMFGVYLLSHGHVPTEWLWKECTLSSPFTLRFALLLLFFANALFHHWQQQQKSVVRRAPY